MKNASSKKPVIGISASLFKIDTGWFRGRERAGVGQDYVQAITQAGGVPVLLPVLSDSEAIVHQLSLIDGLLLSGGYDVQPLLYGEEPDRLLQEIYPERDLFEIQLARLADEQRKPILGICRGIQLLNVAFGGSLYQDVSYHSSSVIQHSQQAQVHVATHTVEIKERTLLKKIIGTDVLVTNSFHHQAVKQIAPGFRVNAVTKDGLIEGIEKIDRPYVLGVQWHPELMFEKHPTIFKLFDSFVAYSKERFT